MAMSLSVGVEVKDRWKVILGKARKALADGKPIRVNPVLVRPMPNQPRQYFSQGSIARLAESIEGIGQIYPGIVRRVDQAGVVQYELLDGERRWRACKLSRVDYKATLVDIDDESVPFIIAAVANFNRETHTPTEVSDSIERMLKIEIPMDEIAKILGISPFWANQMHGLQQLHPKVREMLDPTLPKEKLLPVTAAIQISKVDQTLQVNLASQVVSRKVTMAGLRAEALRVSKRAGTHIRVRLTSVRHDFGSVNKLSQQISRNASDVEMKLGDERMALVLHHRPAADVQKITKCLEDSIDSLKRSLQVIRKARRT